MFKLIKVEESKGLALVEDLECHSPDIKYTHIQYESDGADRDIWLGQIGQPAKYFTYTGYIEYLQDNLSKFQLVDEHAIYELVKIPMVKQIKPVTIESLSEQVKSLKLVVTHLQAVLDQITISPGLKLIEIYKYPTWNTFEEFTKLPDYKYFEAAQNIERYLPLYGSVELPKYIHKYQDKFIKFSQGDPKTLALYKLLDFNINYKFHGRYIIEDKKEILMGSIDCAIYHKYYENESWITNDCLYKSLKKFHFEHGVSVLLVEYFVDYIIGYSLLNCLNHIGTQLSIGIEINDQTAICKIFKSTMKEIHLHSTDSIIYYIPVIEYVKIDGIEYYQYP